MTEPLERLSGLTAAFGRILDDGDAGLGLQVALVGPGGERTWALGTDAWGRPTTDATLHPGYCATKPVLALAVGRLVADGRLSLDDDVGDPELGCGPVTVAEVLAHARADLASPDLTEWRMANRDQRADLWRHGGAAGRHATGPAYSEVVGWTLLATAVSAATGLPSVDVVATSVLGPLGLDDDVVIDPDRLRRRAALGDLSVPVGGLPIDVVPLLTEVTDPALTACGPVGGGFVTARGLARLHAGAHGSAALPEPAAAWRAVRPAARAVAEDGALGQRAGFAGGHMTDLDLFGVDRRLAPGAVGHVGAVIDVIGFHAPALDLGIGIVGNGLGTRSDELRSLRRRATRAIADALLGDR